MNVSKGKFSAYLGLGLLSLLAAFSPVSSQSAPEMNRDAARGAALLPWRTPARWRCGLFRKTSGTLVINDSGIIFQPARGSPLHWSFEDIQTFDLAPRRLVVTGYQNRRWHFPGEREFRFRLGSAIPPSVAAELARRVGKPSENGVPNPNAAAMATIPAQHRTLGGGTDGILRFRETGIDYVTPSGRGERSWRWADIQTIAEANPYDLQIEGYREIFDFELKQPLSSQLFDRLWDKLYGRKLAGLAIRSGPSGKGQDSPVPGAAHSGMTAMNPKGGAR